MCHESCQNPTVNFRATEKLATSENENFGHKYRVRKYFQGVNYII